MRDAHREKNNKNPTPLGSAPWPFTPAGVQPMGRAAARGESASPMDTSGTTGSGGLKLRVETDGVGLPEGFLRASSD